MSPKFDIARSTGLSTLSPIHLSKCGPCITVLSSSGLVHDSILVEPASSSQGILQQGEQQIFDIQVSRDGHKLYTTTGTTVRLWDLNTLSAVGQVASGHQAPIICLSLYNDSRGKEQLLTGSKDHLIKGFDISNEQISNYPFQAKFTMDPPHYDGVQCLAHRQDILFSGSRDMCIKKWNLSEPSSQPQSVNGAHKDWITDMCMLPDNDILLSCCRSGTVKIRSNETCQQLDEVRAHSLAVNSMATNRSNLFTASSDCTIRIWWMDPHKLYSS
ncbi:kinesin-like protein KIF21B [Watersipora subatra]|uniref:kinesin-like protein KIF21B n=1 Tax=Watersipora subatra TaxID=2589382 RepID=UPI00355C1E9F